MGYLTYPLKKRNRPEKIPVAGSRWSFEL